MKKTNSPKVSKSSNKSSKGQGGEKANPKEDLSSPSFQDIVKELESYDLSKEMRLDGYLVISDKNWWEFKERIGENKNVNCSIL